MIESKCFECQQNRCFQYSPESFIRYNLKSGAGEEVKGKMRQDCNLGILLFGTCQICENEGLKCKPEGKERIMVINHRKKTLYRKIAGIESCPIFRNKSKIFVNPQPLQPGEIVSALEIY